MNFSKLNPKNWFKKPSPPDPTASGEPKYRPGQICIVLRCPGRNELIGHQVQLIEVRSYFVRGNTRIPAWCWVTDHSDLLKIDERGPIHRGFPEPDLLPIDDPDLAHEILNETIDDVLPKKVESLPEMDEVDKAIDRLEEAIRKKREKQRN